LGGSAFYTLTLTAASGYDANCTFTVVNEDIGRGKVLAISGVTCSPINCILWPGQTTTIINDNNTWFLFPLPRWKLPNGPAFFVDPVNGSDSNDGLAAGAGGAWQHIIAPGAIQNMQSLFDFNGQNPSVTVAASSTVSEHGVCFGGFVGGVEPTFNFSSVTWNPGAGNVAFQAKDGCTVTFNGTAGTGLKITPSSAGRMHNRSAEWYH